MSSPYEAARSARQGTWSYLPDGRTGPLRVVEPEQRGSDLADGAVERLHRPVDAIGHRRVVVQLCDALQVHADGEEPLDHEIVELAADPFAVTDAERPVALIARSAELDAEGRLVGQRAEQVDVAVDELGLSRL